MQTILLMETRAFTADIKTDMFPSLLDSCTNCIEPCFANYKLISAPI